MLRIFFLWKLRNLTIEGTIVVFKSLALSKLIHLALFIEMGKMETKKCKN